MLFWPLRRFVAAHARRVQASMDDPRAAQIEAFARLRRTLRGSEVARRSGFDERGTLEECRDLPASDAESMRPLFQEVFARGAAGRGITGRSRVVGFARTSGSRGEPKIVPLNRAYLASLDRTLLRVAACQLHHGDDWDTIFSGRQVLLGSRPRCGTSPTGLPVCDMSGFLATRTWLATRFAFVPRHADLWIEDWPVKADRIVEQALRARVVSISGIPALANDFARRILARTGAARLDEVWPSLRRFFYGAVHLSAAQKAELAREWIAPGRALAFYEAYFATEAPLAFSFSPSDPGLALCSLENLYLFRPYSGDRRFLFAHELVEGESYSIHVTTPGGLVNFHMGDRVQVVSRRPLQILATGREGDELSMTGEKITLAQIDLALEAAGLGPARFGSHLPAVWIEDGERPCLVWAIPSETAPDAAAASRLDDALCRVNVLYEEARMHEGVVAPSRIAAVPRAVFDAYVARNAGVGQFKPKRLFRSADEFATTYGWPTTRIRAADAAGG